MIRPLKIIIITLLILITITVILHTILKKQEEKKYNEYVNSIISEFGTMGI